MKIRILLKKMVAGLEEIFSKKITTAQGLASILSTFTLTSYKDII
jgi:hypothetical protein